MKLRVITQITIALTLLALVFVVYTLTSRVIQDFVRRLEEQNAIYILDQIQTTFQNETNELKRLTADWAQWDDTYAFVADPTDAYIQQNFNLPTVQNIHIHEVLVLDQKGQLVFGSGFDLQNNGVTPIPGGLMEQIGSRWSTLEKIQRNREGIGGLIMLPSGPHLISIHPVMDSLHQSPPNGFLVFGRPWDQIVAGYKNGEANLPASVVSISEPQVPGQFQTIEQNGKGLEFALTRREADIAGLFRVDNIFSEPGLAIQVDFPRNITQAGQKTLGDLMIGILLVGIVFIAFSTYGVDKLILRRIASLNAGIARIGKEGGLSTRLPVRGRDELASLADTMNHTLDALEHAQHDRQESEERYQLVVAQAFDAIVLIDPTNSMILAANPAFQTLVDKGNRDGKVVATNVLSYIPPEDHEHWKTVFSALQSGKQNRLVFETRIGKDHADAARVNVRAAQVCNDTGQPLFIMAVMEDITEKKKTGEALRESESRFENLVENLPIGIYRNTPGPLGKIMVANPAYLSMFGLKSIQEAQQIHVADTWVDPSKRKDFSDHIIANGSVTNAEIELKKRDGTHLWGLVTAKAVKDDLGQVQYFDCTIQDITDRKRVEKIQETIYQISQATYSARHLSELYHSIHQSLGNLMHVENFYIALYDEKNQLLSFPYFVDQYDLPEPDPQPLGRGMTEYVLRTRQPALVDPETYAQLAARGEVELIGAQSIDWLGVPLITKDRCIGVIAVQSYTPSIRFTSTEKDILVFVSTQVAWAIERKRADDRIRESETRYRAIVEDQIDLIVRSTPEGIITFANEATGRYFGLHPTDLIGMPFLDLFPSPEKQEVQKSMASLTAENAIAFVETELDRGSQNHRWQEWRHRGLFDDTGSLLEVQSVGLDSTPRKIRDQEMDALLSLSADIRTCDKRSDMLALVGEKISNLFGPVGQILATIDPYSSDFVIELARGGWTNQSGKHISAGNHLLSKAVDTCAPIQTAAPDLELGFNPSNLIGPINFCLVVPLTTRQLPVGAIVIGSERNFRPNEVRLINALADIAANALHRATLFEQTDSRLHRLVALRAIDIAITSSLDLQLTLSVLLDQIVSQLNIHACDVLLYDPYSRLLEFAAGRGFRSSTMQKTRLRMGEGPAGRALTERKLVMISNLRTSLDPFMQAITTNEDFVAYYAVPLIAKGQVRGVLELYHRSPLSPDMEWLDFLEAVATQAAIAIDNAEMFHKLQRSNIDLTMAYDATIEGWSRALELRDHETEGHTKRVTDLTLRLATAWGVPEGDMIHIRRGCLLHDIGKMAIPDQILFKPGPLTEDEWDIMRLHPVYAYRLLSPVPYLRPALDIPYCHHERWDGTGYPRKLAGEQIPLTARLFAVADIWDALRSDRPYRKAWPDADVKAYISSLSGSHLDTRVVNLFLALESR